jgi:hypothetical protein
MAMKPRACQVPKPSLIAAQVMGASFHDAWCMSVGGPTKTALSYFLLAASNTPAWVNVAMAIRNKVVLAFGLKDLGRLSTLAPAKPDTAYQSGDRVGVFQLLQNTPDEVVLGDDDKHLRVVLSLHVAPRNAANESRVVTLTTVVHVHNWLGRFYMLPVTPAHRIIVPAMLRRLATVASAP